MSFGLDLFYIDFLRLRNLIFVVVYTLTSLEWNSVPQNEFFFLCSSKLKFTEGGFAQKLEVISAAVAITL